MGWPVCNNTLEFEEIHEVAVYYGLTFHQLGLVLSAVSGVVAIAVSFYLILMHATHYLRPWEQRHIIRILFMVPIYATGSFLSYLYYKHSIYFETIESCYEAFAIASFFTLLCHYVAEDLHQQKNYFRTIKPRKWVWPMGWLQRCCGGENGVWRTPRSGLTWFNVIWVGVFQYCFIRVFFTIVATVTEFFNLYCQSSLNPAFAHVWTMLFEAIAVTVAMYCLIQFYVQLKDDIAQHKPLLKVLAIKLVIFLSFWQSILISFLTSTGLIKAGPRFGTPDIKIGIPAMLLCVEMAAFSIFHLWAFSWLPYRIGSKMNQAESIPGHAVTSADYQGGFLGWKAVVEAFNPWDLFKAVGRSARWLFVGRKRRMLDPSYQQAELGNGMPIGLATNNGAQSDSAYRPVGKAGQFGDEGDDLLHHAQSTPGTGPPPAYTNDNPYDRHPADAGEIGVAKSDYSDDGHSPIRYPAPSTPGSGRVENPIANRQSFHRPGRSPVGYPEGYGRINNGQYQNIQYEPYNAYNAREQDSRPDARGDVGVPYPEQGQEGQRQNRISMPPMPGQNPLDRGGGRGMI